MFQTASTSANKLQSILEEELQYFNSVLQFSQKFLKQVNSLPIPVLADMVKYRQEWIDKIQKLEEQRKGLDKSLEDANSRRITKQISALAEKLVKTDERIYEGLQNRKLKFVQEHSNIVSENAYTKKQHSSKGHSSKILDIVQE